jgi:hypothetical protein
MVSLLEFFEWYLNEDLQEKQRGEKFGLPKVDKAQRIKAYAKYGYIAHFGDLGEKGRFGMDRYVSKHKFRWDTPSGVYGYPLDLMADEVLAKNVPFAGDSPAIYILRIYRPEKLLNVETYNEGDYERDSKKIDSLDLYDEKFETIAERYKRHPPGTRFLFATNAMTGRNPHEWSSLLRKVGYVGVYDPGTGTIHQNEPTQVVVFGPDQFEIVDTIVMEPELSEEEMFSLARSPSTDPKILRKLARQDHHDLALALAENPNLPPPLFQQLWKRYPGQGMATAILSNPAFPLEMFDLLWNSIKSRSDLIAFATSRTKNPALIDRFLQTGNQNAIEGLLKNPLTPDELVGKLAVQFRNTNAVIGLRKRPRISSTVYQTFWPSAPRKLKIWLSHREDLPFDYFLDLAQIMTEPLEIKSFVDSNGEIPPEALLILFQKPLPVETYQQILMHHNATGLLPQLIQSANVDLLNAVASSMLTPANILRSMLKIPNPQIKLQIARNSAAANDPEIYREIVASPPYPDEASNAVLNTAKEIARAKLENAQRFQESIKAIFFTSLA